MVQKVNQLFELGVSIVISCLPSLLWGLPTVGSEAVHPCEWGPHPVPC